MSRSAVLWGAAIVLGSAGAANAQHWRDSGPPPPAHVTWGAPSWGQPYSPSAPYGHAQGHVQVGVAYGGYGYSSHGSPYGNPYAYRPPAYGYGRHGYSSSQNWGYHTPSGYREPRPAPGYREGWGYRNDQHPTGYRYRYGDVRYSGHQHHRDCGCDSAYLYDR